MISSRRSVTGRSADRRRSGLRSACASPHLLPVDVTAGLRFQPPAADAALADGDTEGDIKADYKDGVLEIRVPVAELASASEPTKIAVSKG